MVDETTNLASTSLAFNWDNAAIFQYAIAFGYLKNLNIHKVIIVVLVKKHVLLVLLIAAKVFSKNNQRS